MHMKLFLIIPKLKIICVRVTIPKLLSRTVFQTYDTYTDDGPYLPYLNKENHKNTLNILLDYMGYQDISLHSIFYT